MQVSRNDVKKVFQDLLDNCISREAADRWAHSVMQAFEEKRLTFVPSSDQERIWNGVMYLYGNDLQEQPSQYMYSDEDIRVAMLKNLGD